MDKIIEKYNKIVKERLQEFEDLQISEITIQVNVIYTSGPTGSSVSNNHGYVTFE